MTGRAGTPAVCRVYREQAFMAESGPPSSPANDVYSLLIIVAAAFMMLGTVVLAVRSGALFDSWLPF